MRFVITGATSFVGGAVVREALLRGHQVTAVVRPSSKKLDVITKENEQALLNGRLLILENDLGQPERLVETVKGGCDVFLHFGWGGSGSDSRVMEALQEKNLENSLNTVRAAKRLGCSRFLFTGSQAEYGMHQGLITEESECSPRSFYGKSKLKMRIQGDALCKELGMEYVHGRIFSAYGPGDHPWTLVESCVKGFLKGEEISLGACRQQWNFIYISDLAAALCALAEAPGERFSELASPVFNLAGEETRPLKEFVEEIHRLCGGSGTPRYGARPENAEGPVNLNPDITKIKDVTGWSPKLDFHAGIQNVIDVRKKYAEFH